MKNLTAVVALILAILVATILIGISFNMLDVRVHAPGFSGLSLGPGGESEQSDGGRDAGKQGGNTAPAQNTDDGNGGQTEVGPGGNPQTAGNVSSVVRVTATTVPVVDTPGGKLLDTTTRILDYESVVYPGNNFSVSGSVTDSLGDKVSGPVVEIYLDNDGTGINQTLCGSGMVNEGTFHVIALVPADTDVGIYNLSARTIGNHRYSSSVDSKKTRLVAETTLQLEVPADLVADHSFPVSVILTEKASGKPVRGQPVSIQAGLLAAGAMTDDQGVARTNVSYYSGGNRTIVASFGGSDGHSGSSIARELSIQEAPAPDWLSMIIRVWIVSIVTQVVLMVAAVISFILIDRARKPANSGNLPVIPETPPDQLPAVMPYRIEYPGIAAPLPAVWGIDKQLDITVVGPQNNRDVLRLYLDGMPADELVMAGESPTASLILFKGSHILTIRDTVESSTVLAESTVRIVDYREEVVRIFNELFSLMRSRFEEISPDSTPREMQWVAMQSLPEDKWDRLDRIVSTFEIANYSLHGVGREDYIRSYLAMRELGV